MADLAAGDELHRLKLKELELEEGLRNRTLSLEERAYLTVECTKARHRYHTAWRLYRDSVEPQ